MITPCPSMFVASLSTDVTEDGNIHCLKCVQVAGVYRNYCHRDSDDDPFTSDVESDLKEDEAAIEEDEYTISSS